MEMRSQGRRRHFHSFVPSLGASSRASIESALLQSTIREIGLHKVSQALADGFDVESQLLLECARQTPDAQQCDEVRRLAASEVDWSKFVGLARRHRVVPHAYLAMKRSAPGQVPPSVMEQLGQRFRRNTTRNLRVAGEMARICRALNEADIPVMCLKGPALAIQLYGGLHGRQFRDLDIMAPPEHIVAVAAVLDDLGYGEVTAPIASLSPSQRRCLMKFHKHIEFSTTKKPSVHLELHWRLADHGEQLSIGMDRLWDDRNQVEFQGSRFHALPPIELLVFLAWHGGMHRWKRLSWLFDLSQALETMPDLDWDLLLRTASQLGVERYMALGLSLVRQLTGTDVPTSLLSRFRVQREVALACHAMLAHETYYENKPFSKLTWTWHMSRSVNQRSYAFFHTFTPRIADIHLSGLRGYLKRWQELGKRTWRSILSVLP